jgi:hypothetical protein
VRIIGELKEPRVIAQPRQRRTNLDSLWANLAVVHDRLADGLAQMARDILAKRRWHPAEDFNTIAIAIGAALPWRASAQSRGGVPQVYDTASRVEETRRLRIVGGGPSLLWPIAQVVNLESLVIRR